MEGGRNAQGARMTRINDPAAGSYPPEIESLYGSGQGRPGYGRPGYGRPGHGKPGYGSKARWIAYEMPTATMK